MALSEHQSDANWDEIWQRFNWDEMSDSEEAMKERLRQRARQYAAPKRKVDLAHDDAHTVLTFQLGSEHYGVQVMAVRGVRTISRITRVPGTPHFYRGVVNVRGQVITVLDLRLFFDIPVGDERQLPDELVVVRGAGLELGLLAHNIEGVQTILASACDPADNMRYALGVTKSQLVLLDVQRLLEDDQLVIGGQEDN